MPKDEADPDDPMLLQGVELHAESLDAVREMAFSFASEMAWLGHGARSLMAIFESPFYAAAHGAWLQLGGEAIGLMVKAACAAASADRIRVGRDGREV